MSSSGREVRGSLSGGATSATADESGDTQEGDRTGAGHVHDEASLLAWGAETLVPGDLEGREGQVGIADRGEAADEDTETDEVAAEIRNAADGSVEARR